MTKPFIFGNDLLQIHTPPYPVEIDFGEKDYIQEHDEIPDENLIPDQNVIWTYEVGDKTSGKPTVLLVHGFGACSMFYFKMWKALSEEFHVVCIDLLGFGRSSRPKFTCKTSEEAEDFFVLSIEKWREQMQLDSFSICCHSFGGYVMGRYALRFSEHIKKLIFLSSLGVDYVPEDIDKGLDEFHKTLCFQQRTVFRLQRFLPKFLQTIAPYSPLRVLGRISGVFLKKGMEKRMEKLPKEEFEAIIVYGS